MTKGLKTWDQMTPKQRKLRVAGLLRANQAKKQAKLDRLGIDPNIWPVCKCGCRRKVKAGRKWITGHNSGITPRHYSEETLAKFRENGRRTYETRKAKGFRPAGQGWNIGIPQTPEAKAKNSAGLKLAIVEGRHDPAANLRKAWANAPLNSKFVSGRGKVLSKHGKFHSVKMNCDFYYDSSWELARMEALEASDTVLAYTRIPCRIEYVINKEKHFYFPDFGVFYADGSAAVEEVKPLSLLKYQSNELKIKALKKYCKMTGKSCHVLTSLAACKQEQLGG